MNHLGPLGAVTHATAEHYGVTVSALRGKSRAHELWTPRRVAMAVCRSHVKASLPEIGHAFHRDHTTILYAVRKFEETATPEERAAAETIARRAGVLKGEE